MNREAIHVEGVKCVKKVQTYIDSLQVCPEDMQGEYAFQIVNCVVGQAFIYWWTQEKDDSLADTLCDYDWVYQWVRDEMVRQGCRNYPARDEYMHIMHYIGRALANL